MFFTVNRNGVDRNGVEIIEFHKSTPKPEYVTDKDFGYSTEIIQMKNDIDQMGPGNVL